MTERGAATGGRDVGSEAAAGDRELRVALAQVNPTVGDLAGNCELALDASERAKALGADVVVLPELAACGYPPEDLIMRPSFVEACERALEDLAIRIEGIVAIVGFVERADDVHNAAAVIQHGRVAGVVRKRFLPNYGVFDELRTMAPGRGPTQLFDLGGVKIGVTICEDIWHPGGPARTQALSGASVLVNLSASPYERGKPLVRERMLSTRAQDNAAFVVFCNLVGGQDELVFDGNSMVVDPDGRVIARAAAFREDLLVADIPAGEAFRARVLGPMQRAEPRDGLEQEVRLVTLGAHAAGRKRGGSGRANGAGHADEPLRARPEGEVADSWQDVYAALVLGTGDYARKNGFREAIVGLSGGIDSALTASVAADALGGENVVGVAMPSRYSAAASRQDAQALAANLGMRFVELPMDAIFEAYLTGLAGHLDEEPGIAHQNIQPRIRGNILMALSNTHGQLVLCTGNKSETSVGFTTLYGDTVGGLAPLRDVLKTEVYELARWRNAQAAGPWIPERSLTRPPSPELKANQTDQDVLPPYAVLDPIVRAYVEDERSVAEIVAAGFDRAIVEWVVARIDRAEFKRRQGPPGIKISSRAFGRDRRMPITKWSPPVSD